MKQAAALLALLFSVLTVQTAFGAGKDKDTTIVRAYVNDSCIIADEPFFLPIAPPKDGDAQSTAKFLPLIGLIVGKLAELLINHEIQSSANKYKKGYVRQDTRYATSSAVNLYRADLSPSPALSLNAHLGCMTIVAGSFKPETTDCSAAYIPKQLARDSVDKPQEQWQTSRTDDSIENQLRRANVCVEGKAHAVYEARFEFSKDGTAYRLRDAGYRIDQLLTTDKKGATRTGLYTLKISTPSATEQQDVLSRAWVNVGTISAGARSAGKPAEAAPWLRVPPLSVEARRNYEERTRIHQQLYGEIQALERALARNQRVLANLDARLAGVSPELVEGMKQERTRLAVQNQSQAAELDARRAEYRELPLAALEFMPVTIEVAVTETESEKKAQLALAELVGSNSDVVASAVGSAATGLFTKSVAAADLRIDPDAASGDYQQRRDAYYDALIASHAPGAPASQESLTQALTQYNAARRSQGLEPIP